MKYQIKNLLFVLVCMGLVSGCTGSPPIHYYTLNIETEAESPSSSTAQSPLAIAVDHISIPEVVDRPQMVLQSGSNQVKLVDDHRWAESLKGEIPRVVGDHLSRLLMTTMVWSYPQVAKGPVDYRIFIDIRRFESTRGSAVSIDALWTIQPQSTEGAVPKTGRSIVQEPVTGEGYEAIAAAHSRALAEISREIANAVLNAMKRKSTDSTTNSNFHRS